MNIFNSINLSNANSKNKIRIYPPLTNSVKFSQNSRKSKTVLLSKKDLTKRLLENMCILSDITKKEIIATIHR